MGIGVFISLVSFFSNRFISVIKSSGAGISPYTKQEEYNKLRLGIFISLVATALVPYSFWILMIGLVIIFVVNFIATIVVKRAERN